MIADSHALVDSIGEKKGSVAWSHTWVTGSIAFLAYF